MPKIKVKFSPQDARKVRALMPVYYGKIRQREDSVFMIEHESHFAKNGAMAAIGWVPNEEKYPNAEVEGVEKEAASKEVGSYSEPVALGQADEEIRGKKRKNY